MPLPTASFGYSANGYDFQFQDSSNGNPSGWLWDFGDGNTNSVANPLHSYSGNGTYQVCLIAINSCGQDTTCDSILINLNGLSGLEQEFSVYPNPVADLLQIHHSASGISFHLELFDQGGKVVLSQRVDLSNQEEFLVDMHSFSDGIYLLSIHSDLGFLTRKILKVSQAK